MGITLALLAMLCFAANIFLVRGAMARMSIEWGFLVMLAVNVLFTAVAWALELHLRGTQFAFQWKGAAWFALSGVVGIFFGRRMLLDTIRTLGPARTSVLHSSSPVVTLIAAWVLVGERLGAYELALMALVIVGLWTTQAPARGGLGDEGHGRSYARTLAAWRANFDAALPRIRELGFDQRFIRMWQYYLSYCGGGFAAGRTDVRQIALARAA